MSRAFELDIPTGAKIIMLALADRAGDDGHSCFPSQKEIKRKTSLSIRSIQTHLNWLEENGYILRKERRRNDGYRTSDEYIVFPVDNSGADISGEKFSGENSAKPHAQILRGNNNSLTESYIYTPEEDTSVRPLEFEMFWSTYPSYRRESRKKAFPAWEKVIREGRATPEQLQASAGAYRASDEATKDGGKYAKGLCAWLNGDRFLWDYTKKGGDDDKSINGNGNKKSALDSLAAGFANAPPAKPVEGW